DLQRYNGASLLLLPRVTEKHETALVTWHENMLRAEGVQEAGGSSDGPKRRRTYIYREREEAEQRLIDDYFGDDEYEPKYPEEKFRRRKTWTPGNAWEYRLYALGLEKLQEKILNGHSESYKGFEVNLNHMFVSPEPNMVRSWVERCELHVRKAKELRDRKTHIDLRQDLVEHLWNNQ
ncbi:hypothetical protein Tco_0665803, partial [Tanacetum coccineum]